MSVKIFLPVAFLLLPFAITGQIHLEINRINLDSLEEALLGSEGIEKVNALNKISLALFATDQDRSIATAKEAIALSEKIDYPKGKADGLQNLGNAYFIIDSLKTCMINYLEALRIYEELPPSVEMGFVLRQLSNLNYLTDRIDKAIIYNRRATGIFSHFADYGYESYPIIHNGLLFTLENKFDSAFYYYDKGLELLEKYPDPWRLSILYLDYGWATFNKGYADQDKDYTDEAMKWYDKCIEVSKEYGLDEEYVSALRNSGFTLITTGTEENIEKGLNLFRQAIPIADSLNELFYIKMGLYRNLGRNEYRLGNYHRAIEYCEQGLREAEEKRASHIIEKYKDPFFVVHDRYYFTVELRRAYSFIYDCYIKLGNYQKALEYYKLKEKFSEEITQENNSKLVAMLEAESENEKTEKQIAMLERDNQINELKVSQSRYFNIAVGILFIILMLIGFLFMRQNKLKNEHKSTLLEQKLLRLQMNPHFIFNAFSNILKFVESNENKKASAYLTTFSKLLRTTLENTREDFVPFEKELGTLKNYLDLQKLRYPDKFEYTIDVDQNIDDEGMSIPPMLVQPFIENAIEHGIRHKKGMGRIALRFILKGKTIQCEVQDDGVGREQAWEAEFKERPEHKSLATEIISDRIKVLNKKFRQKISLKIIDLKSDDHTALGTKVLIDLPYGNVY